LGEVTFRFLGSVTVEMHNSLQTHSAKAPRFVCNGLLTAGYVLAAKDWRRKKKRRVYKKRIVASDVIGVTYGTH